MTIKEVSERFSVSEDTLRYYEKIGLIETVPKSHGKRNYGEKEINNVEFILCMRSAGLNIDILSKYINLIREGDKTVQQRLNLLIEQRKILGEKINEMKRAYEKLSYKIERYHSEILQKENNIIKE